MATTAESVTASTTDDDILELMQQLELTDVPKSEQEHIPDEGEEYEWRQKDMSPEVPRDSRPGHTAYSRRSKINVSGVSCRACSSTGYCSTGEYCSCNRGVFAESLDERLSQIQAGEFDIGQDDYYIEESCDPELCEEDQGVRNKHLDTPCDDTDTQDISSSDAATTTNDDDNAGSDEYISRGDLCRMYGITYEGSGYDSEC